MAGGSTDAAAVLVGVNRMFDLGFTKKELMERGVKLGADVPYCIMRGTALSRDRRDPNGASAIPEVPSRDRKAADLRLDESCVRKTAGK